MASKHIISVIVPSYNHADYVEDAIKSVANQEREDFEIDLIVIDDGSTDKSVKILQEFQETGRYKFKLVLKANEGLCKTLNRAIREHAIGSYIAILASDDMWRVDKLKMQFRILRSSGDCELCYSNAETLGENRRKGTSSTFMFSGWVKPILTIYNFVPAGTILFTRRLFDEIGGFDDGGLKLEDWDFLLRASAATRFCYVRDNLLFYRIHSEGSLIKMRKIGVLFDEKMKVLRKNRQITSPLLRAVSTTLHFGLDRMLRPCLYKLGAVRS